MPLSEMSSFRLLASSLNDFPPCELNPGSFFFSTLPLGLLAYPVCFPHLCLTVSGGTPTEKLRWQSKPPLPAKPGQGLIFLSSKSARNPTTLRWMLKLYESLHGLNAMKSMCAHTLTHMHNHVHGIS